MNIDTKMAASLKPSTHGADFAQRVHVNQPRLASELRPHYDFIVCGSGSSGSVVARRLAENPDVSVLLLEAGGSDDVPSVIEAGQWHTNLGSDRDWAFQAQPNPHLNGRSIPMNMGKVLGGGSSINVMVWARGHKNDWDYFASETGDPAWSYESVLNISTAASKIGMERPTQSTVEREGRFLFNPCLTPAQLLWPWLKEHVRSGSQLLKIRTVA
jgi:choline dehydrogenase-like flavoprotein